VSTTSNTVGHELQYSTVCVLLVMSVSCSLYVSLCLSDIVSVRVCVCVCRCLDVSVCGLAGSRLTDTGLLSVITHCQQLDTLTVSTLTQVHLVTTSDTLRYTVGCVAQLAERRSLAGELTLSCARPAVDG